MGLTDLVGRRSESFDHVSLPLRYAGSFQFRGVINTVWFAKEPRKLDERWIVAFLPLWRLTGLGDSLTSVALSLTMDEC